LYHYRLGGNPCCTIVASKNPTPYQQQNCRYNSSTIQIGGDCTIVASKNPTPYQQQNCRYNSSTIQIGGDIHHNNFPTFQTLNIHGKVKDCALFILHLQYTQ